MTMASVETGSGEESEFQTMHLAPGPGQALLPGAHREKATASWAPGGRGKGCGAREGHSVPAPALRNDDDPAPSHSAFTCHELQLCK